MLTPRLAGWSAGLVVAAVFAGVVLSVAGSNVHTLRTQTEVAARFLEEGVATWALKLESVGAFFSASEFVSPEEFERFTSQLLRDGDPSGVSVARHVPRSELDQELQTLRQWYAGLDASSYDTEQQRRDLVPRDLHYIVVYQAPVADQLLLGIDLASEPTRRAAVESALSSDATIVSGFVRLLGSTTSDGFVLATPVRAGASGRAVALTAGNVSAMVESLVPTSLRDDVALTIIGPDGVTAPVSSWLRPTTQVDIAVPGRTWTVVGAPVQLSSELLALMGIGAAIAIVTGLGTTRLVGSLAARRRLDRRLQRAGVVAAERDRTIDALADFELLARNSSDVILRLDAGLVVRYISPAVETVLGFAPEDSLGRALWGSIHPDDRPLVQAEIDRLFDGAETSKAQHRLLHQAGHWVWVEASSRAIRDESGRLVEIQSASRDITETVLQREALIDARTEMERSTSEKVRWLNHVSHEIRTPLSAITGISELLADTSLDEIQRDYVTTISRASSSVVTLIGDLLDVSKAEAGRLVLNVVPFQISEVVTEVAHLLEPQTYGRPVTLEVGVESDPGTLMGDPYRIRQVLINLVGNALKFTSDGSVRVTVDRRDAGEGRTTVLVKVIDTGIGIAPDRLQAVFEPYEQADTSISGSFGGTGLGLVICRQLVELMGGVIGVDSKPGEGSTFWFECTLAAPDDDRRKCVLVGAPTHTESYAVVLRAEGWTVIEEPEMVAAPGPVILVAALDDVDPDAALTGVVMVDLSPRRGNAERVRLLGATGYVGAPVAGAELSAIIETASGADFSTRYDLPQVQHRLNILAADDSQSNRLVLESALSRRGHHVVAVEDGIAALEQWGAGRFDVVILDSLMPQLGGVEVAEMIRAREHPGSDRVRIVFVTGRAGEDERQRAMSAGADSYLTKPYDLTGLYRVVEGSDAIAPPPEDGFPLVDSEVLVAQLGDDPKLHAELAASLALEWDELAGTLEPNSAATFPDTAASSAHRLRGALGLIGARRAGEIARLVEETGNRGDAERAAEHATALGPVMTATLAALREPISASQPKR